MKKRNRADLDLSLELAYAEKLWELTPRLRIGLDSLVSKYEFSCIRGDLLLIDRRWYVSHSGLLGLARRKQCAGISVEPVASFCDPQNSRFAFKATVYRSLASHGFVGFGDADPLNTSIVVRGAEMRIAETRAVNRALRKAYGIGICSVEELGAFPFERHAHENVRKLSPEPTNKNGANGRGSRVRDRLCQLIRRHQLDAELVKAYATDFCGTKTLREATREQVENFVAHLAEWAKKDRNALLCQLNSYGRPTAGAA